MAEVSGTRVSGFRALRVVDVGVYDGSGKELSCGS